MMSLAVVFGGRLAGSVDLHRSLGGGQPFRQGSGPTIIFATPSLGPFRRLRGWRAQPERLYGGKSTMITREDSDRDGDETSLCG